MAAFGAVGRFGVAGWREDLLVLLFQPESAIVLGEASLQVGGGGAVAAALESLVLSDVAYQATFGAATVNLAVGDAFVLGEVEFDIPAGNKVDFEPDVLDLATTPFAAYSGVAIDFALPMLVLGEAEYAPGSGTMSSFVPASEIVISDTTLSPQSGASVQVLPMYREFYAAAVASFAVAGGPVIQFPIAFSLDSIATAPQSGASPRFAPENLILGDLAFEVGARRKPVRGQFLIYN